MNELYDVLRDRQQWNECPTDCQDQIAEQVGQALGPAFAWLETRSYACQQVSHRVATFRHQRTGIDLQLIPGGEYAQGTSDVEAELAFICQFRPARDTDFFELERSRAVSVPPLLIGRFPVTFAQWGKVQRRRKGQAWKGRSFPLEGVSWERIQAWLSRAGDGLRLPWTHEWEYACRAGTETRFFWGQEMDPAYCWMQDNSSGQTHKVNEHQKRPNAFGLIDTLGNVAEWCQDTYEDWEVYYADEYHVTRGGHVGQDAALCRCANIGLVRSGAEGQHVGFRVVRTLPGMEE